MDKELRKEMERQLDPMKDEIFEIKTDMAAMKANMATKDDIAQLKERMTRLEVIVENDVAMKINLMYEGFVSVMEKMKESSRNAEEIADTMDRVHTLEAVAKNHYREIQDIKKKIG